MATQFLILLHFVIISFQLAVMFLIYKAVTNKPEVETLNMIEVPKPVVTVKEVLDKKEEKARGVKVVPGVGTFIEREAARGEVDNNKK